jgi:DNA modification methylase
MARTQATTGHARRTARAPIDRLPLGELKPLQPNARQRTERSAGMLVESLQRFGAARSIVIDEDNVVLAGNGTTDAAAAAGIARVRVVEAAGDELIAVRRRGLTPEQKAALALADNRTAELAVWDNEVIARLVAEMPGLTTGLWSDQELRELLASVQPPAAEDPGAQTDHAAALQREWHTATGQLWRIPSKTLPDTCHLVCCGDTTRSEDVARVMAGARYDLLITDPPYGVSYAAKNAFLNAVAKGTRIQQPILGDDAPPEAMFAFWHTAFTALRAHAAAGAGYYVTGPQGGDLLFFLLRALKESGFPLRHMLIWAKNNHVLGRSDYHYQHEPLLYGWVDGAAHTFNGGPGETSLWEIDKPLKSELHPTMKPVELFERAIRNGSHVGDLVCDGFGGSGTTVVACERTARGARVLEQDPGYCAVILQRLADMGLEPRRSDGE